MTTSTAAPIRVTAFAYTGYPVADIKRARAFYEGLLGLKPSTVFEGESWVEYELGDSTLALNQRPADEWSPSSNGPAIAFEVAEFEETVAALRNAGTTFKFEPMEFPPCNLAIVLDPDGNQLIIHRRKAQH